MTLEKLIRYAITGIIEGSESEDSDQDIQELVGILIDFPNDTDKDLRSILSGRWNPYQEKSRS